MTEKQQVIFDFDGTIVSGDTGFAFYEWLVKRSIWRTFFLILLLPLLIFLRILAFITNSRWIKKFGLNVVCFVATCGVKVSLFSLRRAFIDYYFNEKQVVIYKEAVKHLLKHEQRGDEILVLSGCPDFILKKIMREIPVQRMRVIGSQMTVKAGSLLLASHCYERNKPAMAKAMGISVESTNCLYTDSLSDWPLALYAKKVVLINSTGIASLVFRYLCQVEVSRVEWV